MARMGEERGAYRVLVGKPKGKRPLGRPTRRWVDNIGSFRGKEIFLLAMRELITKRDCLQQLESACLSCVIYKLMG